MPRPPITRARPYTPKSGAFAGQTFTTERQYRNALARRKGFRSWYAQQRARREVRTATGLAQLRPAAQEAYERALDALALMRRDRISLSQAATRAGTTRNTVRRYAGSAIRKDARGRYAARPSDRLIRRMRFLTPRGQITLDVTNSRTASRIARYFAAVDRYLKTGKTDALREFRGKAIRVGKVAYPFITDPRTLSRLGRAGEVSFEDLYDFTL